MVAAPALDRRHGAMGGLVADGQIARRVAPAYHEAGHAVVGYCNGRRVLFVSTIPDGETLGVTRFRRFDPDRATRRTKEAEIMAFLAGSQAEQRHTGRWNSSGAAVDRATVADLVLSEVGSAAEADAYVAWLAIRAGACLTRWWPLVELVAQRLLLTERLTGAELSELARVSSSS